MSAYRVYVVASERPGRRVYLQYRAGWLWVAEAAHAKWYSTEAAAGQYVCVPDPGGGVVSVLRVH